MTNYYYMHINKKNLPEEISVKEIESFFEKGLPEAIEAFVKSPKNLQINASSEELTYLQQIAKNRENIETLIKNSAKPLEITVKENQYFGIAFNLNLIAQLDDNLESPKDKFLDDYSPTELLHYDIREALFDIKQHFITNFLEKKLDYLVLDKGSTLPLEMEHHTLIATKIDCMEFKEDAENSTLKEKLQELDKWHEVYNKAKMKI